MGTRTQSLASSPSQSASPGAAHGTAIPQPRPFCQEPRETADQPGGQLPIRITLKLGEPDGEATTQLCTHAWGEEPWARDRTQTRPVTTLSDTWCVLH